MPHLAHHRTSKCDSPNKPKVKGKITEAIPDLNSILAKSMTHLASNQATDHLVSQSPPYESIDNKSTKFEVQIQDPMKHS
jgi:hypothetical protein